MANITIRNLDNGVKIQLRKRATGHGRSVEEEVRAILHETVKQESPPTNLLSAIRARFAPLGGVELELPARKPLQEPRCFE